MIGMWYTVEPGDSGRTAAQDRPPTVDTTATETAMSIVEALSRITRSYGISISDPSYA